MNVGWAAFWAAVGGFAAVVGASVCTRVRYARQLTFFRCRIGPPLIRLRPGARWRMGRRQAAWAGTVLLVSSGLLRLIPTPLATGLPRTTTVRPLAPDRVRGLGAQPVSMMLTTHAGRPLEIAVPKAYADEVAGPFFAAAMPELPPTPRDQSS